MRQKLSTFNSEKYKAIRKSRSENLILRNNVGIISSDAIIGEVISIIGKDIIVEAKINNKPIEINCVLTGTIISTSKYSNLIAAGDIVYFIYDSSGLSKIIKVVDRLTKFSRILPSNRNREQVLAANVDTLLIFVSGLEPVLNTRLIDRYLVSSILSKIIPIICVNKMDLCSNKLIRSLMLPYIKLGIEVHFISVLNDIGVNRLKQRIVGQKSVISGVSGSGKSSFLNVILGYNAQVVRDISKRTNKGIHTTSFSKRYKISNSGWIIDTPGLREFGIWDLTKEEIGVIFPDFSAYYLNCKYTSCTHTHEPDCAVITAVDQGIISAERYNSYLNIYDCLE